MSIYPCNDCITVSKCTQICPKITMNSIDLLKLIMFHKKCPMCGHEDFQTYAGRNCIGCRNCNKYINYKITKGEIIIWLEPTNSNELYCNIENGSHKLSFIIENDLIPSYKSSKSTVINDFDIKRRLMKVYDDILQIN